MKKIPFKIFAPDFFALIFVLSIGLYRIATVTADPDLWGYLAFGKLFWSRSGFPFHDVFSYVPTLDPWVYHEWLTGVIFYPIYVKYGSEGLQILKYITGAATFSMIYLTARVRASTPIASCLALYAALSGWIIFAYGPVRAQIFTCFFFALILFILEFARLKQKLSILCFIPLVIIFWANLHGGFPVGLGLIAIYCVGALITRKYFLFHVTIFLLSCLVTAINPYGLTYWSYMVRAVLMPRPDIWEWASLWNAFSLKYIGIRDILGLGAMVCLAIVLVIRKGRKDYTMGLALSATLFFGLLHIRHLVFFYILMGAFLPTLLTFYTDSLKANTRLKSLSIVRRTPYFVYGVIGIASIAFFLFFLQKSPLALQIPSTPQPRSSVSPLYYPVKAVNYLEDKRLSGNILTEFGWGEYVMWRLYPRCKVALDGRYETVYPDAVSQKYFDFTSIRSNAFLIDYPPDMILIVPRRAIIDLIQAKDEWQQIYSDDGSVLFARKRILTKNDNR